jgi:hypothetical protein
VRYPLRPNSRARDFSIKGSTILVYCPIDEVLPFAIYFPGPNGHRVRFFSTLSDAQSFASEQVQQTA